MTRRAPLRAAGTMLLAALLGVMDAEAGHASERGGVSIGDVKVAEESGAKGAAVEELGRALRAALSAELGRASLGAVKRPLLLSATLTQLSSEKRDQRTKASASISIALSRADDRVIFAELRGRASVEEASRSVASLHREALEGAVHGACARLPEAVRRSP